MVSFQSKCLISFLVFLMADHTPVSGQAKQTVNHFATAHSLSAELRSFYDISALPSYLSGTEMAQISSYDTTGGNDDGFNGKYSYIRRNADSSLVLADLHGPGVINRIWTPTPTSDTLDFYIDDNSRPALSIRFIDLFSGKVFPFIQPLCGNQLGGYYCYFPILFQKSCVVVDRGKKIQFHQIQYRLFPGETKVKRFNAALDEEEKQALTHIAALWSRKERQCSDFLLAGASAILRKEIKTEINPGESKPIFNLNRGGRILGIEFIWTGNSTWNKNIDLKVNWDNEKVPAIYCPIEDFFGFAFGSASMQSLLLGSREHSAYCFFPMPFDQNASIELVYRKGEIGLGPIKVHANITYVMDKRQPEKEGRFYASWNCNELPAGAGPHVLLSANGRGHYVGSILQASSLYAGMTYFFEGDDSTAIDGKPRIHGTGSEDYFNGGWYALLDRWDTRMSLPLHGALDYSLPFCRTGGFRLYLNDKISFEKSIYQSIEHGPVNNSSPAKYCSIGLYYNSQAPAHILEPVNGLTRIAIPDTMMIYPQLMEFTTEGDTHMKTVWGNNTGGLSYVLNFSGESAIRISLNEIPEGNYKLIMDYTKIPDGCQFSIWKRQTQLSEWINSGNQYRERVPSGYLCDLEISSLAKSVTIRFKPSEQKNGFLLNRIILVKKT
ncbi:MAG: glycoside hydrolase family 172 protein [Chitinophagales bacterium]